MIVIFVIFLATALANSSEKYKNLLPDAEKQEIQNEVVGKSTESVQSNSTSKQSTEITDEQLKTHNSQVQSILEEEKAAFEAVRYKGVNGSKKYIKHLPDDEKQVFLNNIARTIMESIKSNSTNKQSTEITDEQLNAHNSNIQSILDQEKAAFEAGRYKGAKGPEKYINHLPDEEKQEFLNKVARRILESVKSNGTLQQSVKNDVNRDETIKSQTITSSNEEGNDIKYPETSTANSKKQLYTTTENLEESSAKTKNLKMEDTNDRLTSSNDTLEYNSATNSNSNYLNTERTNILMGENTPDINSTNNKSADVSTNFKSPAFATTTQNTANVNPATENYSSVTKYHSTKESLETVIEMTTLIPTLTTINIKEEKGYDKPDKIKTTNAIEQPDNDTVVSYVVKKALNKIKHELELAKKGKFIESEIETSKKGNTHLNHYRVYEIPWPIKRDNQPFLRSQKPTKDQPYFVPVYKYSPNFAYYNPKNRLGPSVVEDNSIELETRHLRESNNDLHDKAESSEFVLQLNNELRKFITPKKNKTTSTTTIPDLDSMYSPSDYVPHEHDEDCENCTVASVENGHKDKDHSEKHEYKAPNKADILSVVDERDVFMTLEQLESLDIPLMRSNAGSKVSVYMNVLKDLILEDSKSLKQYDWLKTTVDIQSALSKILKLINSLKQSEPLHPADLQILRNMVFLHNLSLQIKEENQLGNKLTKKMKLWQRNKKKKKNNKLLKDKSLINRVWLYLRSLLPDLVEEDEFNDLYEFFIDVQDGLFDLHEAIRHIAGVTKFNHQNWYDNLKQLYLSADVKHLRELLLHISMSRLVDLLEHSLKHGLNTDVLQFMKGDTKNAARIVEEMLLIDNIVDEIKLNV